MRKYFIVFGFCFIALWACLAYADKLSSYPQTTTMANGDRLPVIKADLTNANLNWSDLKEIMSKSINWADAQQLQGNNINWTGAQITGRGINWSDIRVYGSQHGDHSGINWASFGV